MCMRNRFARQRGGEGSEFFVISLFLNITEVWHSAEMFDQTGVPKYNLASSCDSYSARSFFLNFFTYTWPGALPGFRI